MGVMASAGMLPWHVLRIDESDIFDDIDGVVQRIAERASERASARG